MKFIIEKNTLGLVIKNNNKIKCYGPGVHNTFRSINFILNDNLSLEQQKFDINKYFFDDDFNNYIEKVIIEEGCFMIRYVTLDVVFINQELIILLNQIIMLNVNFILKTILNLKD